jgi:hypothetical protein
MGIKHATTKSDADTGYASEWNAVHPIDPGTIVDADINAAAAIAYSKLNLAGAILDADISASAAIARAKMAAPNYVVSQQTANYVPDATTFKHYGCGAISPKAIITPHSSGIIGIRGSLVIQIQHTATLAETVVGGRYGSGSAPAQGDAVTGTAWGDVSGNGGRYGPVTEIANLPILGMMVLDAVLSGLTLETAYWFDLVGKRSGGTMYMFSPTIALIEL